jgi:hypothetical protein
VTGRRRRPNAFQRARAERARRREETVPADDMWRDDTQVIPALRDETQVISTLPLLDAAPLPRAGSRPDTGRLSDAGSLSDTGPLPGASSPSVPAAARAERGSRPKAASRRHADTAERSDGAARSDTPARHDGAARSETPARHDGATPTGSPEAEPRPDAYPPPLYARALFLQNLQPGPLLCFLFFEGAIATGAVFALTGKATAWAALVLPATVAAVVKLNDVVAGAAKRRAGVRPGVAARGADPWPELEQPVRSDPVKEAHMEWRRGLRPEVTTSRRQPLEGFPSDHRTRDLPRDW